MSNDIFEQRGTSRREFLGAFLGAAGSIGWAHQSYASVANEQESSGFVSVYKDGEIFPVFTPTIVKEGEDGAAPVFDKSSLTVTLFLYGGNKPFLHRTHSLLASEFESKTNREILEDPKNRFLQEKLTSNPVELHAHLSLFRKVLIEHFPERKEALESREEQVPLGPEKPSRQPQERPQQPPRDQRRQTPAPVIDPTIMA